MATVANEVTEATLTLIGDLRAGGKLLGKLYRLEDGRRVVELVCRGRGCERWCYFDVETGERVTRNA